MQPLPNPTEPDDESDPFFNKRPVLALLYVPYLRLTITVHSPLHFRSGEESTQYRIQFYSMALNALLPLSVEFDAPLLDVKANRHVIVVTSAARLWVLNAKQPERVRPPSELYAAPDLPLAHGICALGPRWLAYPTPHAPHAVTPSEEMHVPPPGPSESASSLGIKSTADLLSVARDSMRGAAKNVMYLSSKTMDVLNQSIINSMAPESTDASLAVSTAHSTTTPMSATAMPGVIRVVDIISFETIAHFKAHTRPVATLNFDPTGTLLTSASHTGQDLKVHLITPHTSPLHAHKLLYLLERGVTAAALRDVVVSHDARLIAATSSPRATTHLWPITPTGQEISADSHLDARRARPLNPLTQSVQNFPHRPDRLSKLPAAIASDDVCLTLTAVCSMN